MLFNNYWKKYNEQLNRAERLQQRVNQLEALIKDHNNDHEQKAREDVATSTFSLDFDTMNVFSIERMVGSDHSAAHTVVGYFVLNPTEGSKQMSRTVHEWTLRCSHDEHERLVAEFNAWKADRK